MHSTFLKSSQFQNMAWLLIALLPVFVYFFYVFLFAVNVPQLDDFHAIFKSMERIYQSKTLGEATYWAMDFHNEHRLAYTRFVSLVFAQINGGIIDLKWLIFVGNLSLVGTYSVLFFVFRAAQIPLHCFLPVSFLLFQMQFFENTFFAMAALQNLSVWFFAIGCLYLLIFKNNYFGGLLAAFLATNTSGNGLFLFLIIPFILATQKSTWQAWLFWLVGFGLAGLEYHNRFTFSNSSSGTLFDKMYAFLGLLGSFGGAKAGFFLGFMLLTIVLICTGHLLLKNNLTQTNLRQKIGQNLTKPRLFCLGFLGFIMLTALAIAANREVHLVVSTSRYKIVSAMALIGVYLLAIQAVGRQLKPVVFTTALLFAVCFCGFTYHKCTPVIWQHRSELLKDARDFKQTGKVNNAVYLQINYRPENDWQNALKRGIYRFPVLTDSTNT